MKVRKGDEVIVIAGKDRGKTGKVLRSFPKHSRVVVEGANKIKRHMKAQRPAIQGGVVEREAPITISNVMLLCDKCHHPAKVGFRRVEEGKVRVCRVCGEVID